MTVKTRQPLQTCFLCSCIWPPELCDIMLQTNFFSLKFRDKFYCSFESILILARQVKSAQGSAAVKKKKKGSR